jgi:hypothetical protein
MNECSFRTGRAAPGETCWRSPGENQSYFPVLILNFIFMPWGEPLAIPAGSPRIDRNKKMNDHSFLS